mmetsp:Transcript_23981/g.56615  ORF Transcript_23981/g.56615 Transcript_23981/m.56615 type:complete len:136 (+) Transcript_23981:189-596(+)
MLSRKSVRFAPLLYIALSLAMMSYFECQAFAPAFQISRKPQNVPLISTQCDMLSTDSYHSLPSSLIMEASPTSSTSIDIAAATLDPTTILSDVFGVFIGTPIILLVPIVAALGVAGVLVWGIVAYANPEVEDDEI